MNWNKIWKYKAKQCKQRGNHYAKIATERLEDIARLRHQRDLDAKRIERLEKALNKIRHGGFSDEEGKGRDYSRIEMMVIAADALFTEGA